jgi:hypothetical protein
MLDSLLACVVLDTGWMEGLDVLASAGDRFDVPWVFAGDGSGESGLSALEQASAAGLGPSVRRMLALGANPNGRAGYSPLSSHPTENWKHYHAKSVTRAFIEGGVDPWANSRRMQGRPLTLGLLVAARPIEALLLLQHAKQLPAGVDPQEVWGIWLEGVRRFRRSE